MIAKVKNIAILRLKKIFYRWGFIVNRIPDENTFFENLAYAPIVVKQHELKKLAQHIKESNNHKLYNKIFKKDVCEWEDNFSKEEFMGNGTGENSFDVYRKVCINNENYFEKVYFNDSYDLLKSLWFYEHIYPILKNHLKIPKIHKILKGKLLTIIYFEYLDLVPLSSNEIRPALFDLSRTLLTLSNNTEKFITNSPDYLKKYTSHFQYYKNLESAKKLIKELSDNTLSTSMIEQALDSQSLIITHGDICETNIFADNCVIDWDSFGFFPLGFGSALILAIQEGESPTISDLQELLIEEYKELINKEQWDDFELSYLYFYLVFTSMKEQLEAHIILQKNIFSRIKELYYNKSG